MDSMFGGLESSTYPYMLKAKIILLGDHAVGKSSIIHRYVNNFFQETKHATVGIDFMSKTVKVKNSGEVKLQMWDTAGQERFRSLIPGYLKDSMAALIIFDLSNPRSFDNTISWINLVRDVRGVKTRMFLLGNKADLKETSVIDTDGIKQFAKEQEVKYFEVSAKNGLNIHEMFQEICVDLMEDDSKQIKSTSEIPSSSKLADMPHKKAKKHCCGGI